MKKEQKQFTFEDFIMFTWWVGLGFLAVCIISIPVTISYSIAFSIENSFTFVEKLSILLIGIVLSWFIFSFFYVHWTEGGLM